MNSRITKLAAAITIIAAALAVYHFSGSIDGTTTTKVGFDCTKLLGSAFPERLSVPDDVLKKIDPLKLLTREKWERIPVEPWG